VEYINGVAAKSARIWINNNTSGQNSVLGNNCRLLNQKPATSGTFEVTFDASAGGYTGAALTSLGTAFFCFGTETDGGFTMTSILIEEVTE
jgi:hypothetical protein